MSEHFAILMSGGTTSVINATLCGLLAGIRMHFPESRVFAGYPGITGMLEGNLVELTGLSNQQLREICLTPASGFIGTTRIKTLSSSEFDTLRKRLREHRIGTLFNIGGNGTIKQSRAMNRTWGDEFRVVALPKTVDNDLGDAAFEDVYFTPGFPSCANYWRHKVRTMNFESLGAFSHDKVLIAQTFGRETGFLTACARLADPDRETPLMLLLPEDQQPLQNVLDAISDRVQESGRCMVVMTEGYEVNEFEARHDPSGQIMYGSSGSTCAQELVNACMRQGLPARAFIPGFDQRSDMSFVSTIDLESAFGVGSFAVRKLASGESNFFASIRHDQDALNGIGFHTIALDQIGNYSRKMPDQWIDFGNWDVTNAFLAYVENLIGFGVVPPDRVWSGATNAQAPFAASYLKNRPTHEGRPQSDSGRAPRPYPRCSSRATQRTMDPSDRCSSEVASKG